MKTLSISLVFCVLFAATFAVGAMTAPIAFCAAAVKTFAAVTSIRYHMLDKGGSLTLPAPAQTDARYISSDEKIATVKGSVVRATGNGDCAIFLAEKSGKQTTFARLTVGWPVQNPVLPYSWNICADDSEVHNFGGKLYTYSCLDSSPRGYASPYYVSLSTADLRLWDCQTIFSSFDPALPLKGKILWDCDGAFHNGKYLLYGFTAPNFARSDNPMFVLSADAPRGVFKDFRWIVGDKSGTKIDGMSAQVFTDTDGSRYITYAARTPETGNYNCPVVARLKNDNTIDESSVKDLSAYMKDYFENPSLRKRGDTYYFLYAENCGKVTKRNWTPLRLSYATSKSIFGIWTYRGTILTVEHFAGDTNIQGCIEPLGEQWCVFYHRALNGQPFRRTLCVEKIEFDANGLIKPVVPTSSGIAEGLDTKKSIWFNTAVFGKNYKPSLQGKDGSVLVSGRGVTEAAEIGFRYILFTGNEKKISLRGIGLQNIISVKVFADKKLIGENKGVSEILLRDIPNRKTEMTLVVSALGNVFLETLDFGF
jgi:hypothetical protein